jgi:hypothetical protein
MRQVEKTALWLTDYQQKRYDKNAKINKIVRINVVNTASYRFLLEFFEDTAIWASDKLC